jgi:hypothetical protein
MAFTVVEARRSRECDAVLQSDGSVWCTGGNLRRSSEADADWCSCDAKVVQIMAMSRRDRRTEPVAAGEGMSTATNAASAIGLWSLPVLEETTLAAKMGHCAKSV